MRYLILTLSILTISCDDSNFRDDFSYFEDSNYNYQFRIDGYFHIKYLGSAPDSIIGIIYLFENGLYFELDLSPEKWEKNDGDCYVLPEYSYDSELGWGAFQVIDSGLINMQRVNPKNRDVNSSPYLILEGKYLISKETYDHFGFGDMTPQEIQVESPIYIYEFFPCTDKPDSSRSHIYRHFNG